MNQLIMQFFNVHLAYNLGLSLRYNRDRVYVQYEVCTPI